MKKKTILLVLLCCLLFTACKSEEAKHVDALIKNIGEVTLDSNDAIHEAEEALKKLTPKQEAQLDLKKQLTDARSTYYKLVIEKQAKDFDERILKIDTVSLDEKQEISSLRSDYRKLKEEVKEQVINSSKLDFYEQEILRLEAENVITYIDAIGEVSSNSEEAISAARNAYDKLRTEAKALVNNYDVLTQSEAVLKTIEENEYRDALSRVNTKYDKVDKQTLYIHKSQPVYSNIRSYIGATVSDSESGSCLLAMVLDCFVDDTIFVDEVAFLIDGVKYEKEVEPERTYAYNGTAELIILPSFGNWEFDGEHGTKEIMELIANSNETIVRFRGDDGTKDMTVSQNDKNVLKDMLIIHNYLLKY